MTPTSPPGQIGAGQPPEGGVHARGGAQEGRPRQGRGRFPEKTEKPGRHGMPHWKGPFLPHDRLYARASRAPPGDCGPSSVMASVMRHETSRRRYMTAIFVATAVLTSPIKAHGLKVTLPSTRNRSRCLKKDHATRGGPRDTSASSSLGISRSASKAWGHLSVISATASSSAATSCPT